MQNNKLANLENKKIRLIRNIEVCENAKIKVIRFVDKLNAKFADGNIRYETYESTLNNVLKNRTLEQWVEYYNNCIKTYNNHLEVCETKIKQTENNKILLTTLLIFTAFGLLGLGLFYLDSDITGFAVLNATSEENLSVVLMNDTVIDATVNITSYSCDWNGSSFEVCESVEWSNGSYAKGYISGTKPLPQIDPEIDSPFTYCQTTDKEGSKALHAYVYDSNDQVLVSQIDAKVRCEITNITANITSEIVDSNLTQEINITANASVTQKVTIANAEIENEQTIQYSAIVGQTVKWKKFVKLKERTTNLEIELPKDTTILSVKKIENNETIDITSEVINSPNPLTGFAGLEQQASTSLVVEQEVEEIEIEYETEAPQIYEESIEGGKRVTISSALSYENVLTFTSVTETKQALIKLYWIINGSRQSHEITDYRDSNNNGLIDEIYWITPHLSNQTFEIIVITSAQHLDENYTFVSDIYNETKDLDDVWSEAIYHGEYARVIFENNLTSEKDITVYARNSSSDTVIEVYYVNTSNKIAEFSKIEGEGNYKVLLTNLSGAHSTFDLRINNLNNDSGAYIEFDYIVDPFAFPDGGTDLGAIACELGDKTANADTLGTACVGTYPGTCGTADRLCDDSNTETIPYNKNAWGNIHIQTGNSSITSCDSLGDVWLCYDWNVDATDPTQCIVKVDADANASFTNVNTTCFNGGISSPGLICQNVTNIGESWTCGSFFGSGTKAVARIGVTRTSNGGQDSAIFDALFFNVTYFEAADTTRPSAVNLTMPPNNELNSSTTWSFESNASDSVGVVNATLYHNISGSWVANQTVTVSGTSQVKTIINVSNVVDGRYIWNVQWCDAAGNCNQSNANFTFTVDSTRPSSVNLSSPANATINTSRTWRFDSNASDALGLVNATLYHNISGSWVANQTVTVSGANAVTSINVSNIVDGGYTWNVQWCDAAGNCNQSTNRTFTVNNPPSGINLTNPPNATSNSSTSHVFFSNASDARQLANATLYHNISGSWVANQTVDRNGTFNTSSFSVANIGTGGYTWNMQWCDTDSNCTQANSNSTFTVTAITNVAPTAHNISAIAAQSITESSTTAVTFSFLASDSDGVADLNDSSATAEFQAIGEATRSNSSCLLAGDLDSSTANYTCTIDLWYFDAPGNWTVNVTIKDLSSETGANISSNFTLQQTSAMVMAPSALTWPALSIGTGNYTSTNDPLTINNTGNKIITIGNLNITAINLQGEIIKSRYLNVSNFTVSTITGGSPPVECDGTQLVNNTAVVAGQDANLTRGNNSINNNVTGQEQVYFCLVNITAGATPQSYSTGNVGLWTVSIQ